MTSLPDKTEAIVRNLARLYALKNQTSVVELLVRSTAEMIQSFYDNWNGGTYGYTLTLHAPVHLYSVVEERIPDLERELLERASPLLRGFENESLQSIVITLELEADASWRENATKWLEQQEASVPTRSSVEQYDFFLSHATEDKELFARPLANKLRDRGARVWFDEFTLTIGDSLRRSIDKGLAKSRFGIVVLSPSFFAKNWPQYELDGLTAKQIMGEKVILPIWHQLERDEIVKHSPPLADMLAFTTSSMTVDAMVAELMGLIRTP